MELEPGNAQMQAALEKARSSLEKQQAEGKVRFKSKKPRLETGAGAAPTSTAAKIALISARMAGEAVPKAPVGPVDQRIQHAKSARVANVLSHLGGSDEEED